MKTRKQVVLVICGILHCIMSGITFTGSPQYSVTVMINNYTNPTQATPVKVCNGSSCIMVNETKCCNGFNPNSSQCNCCDSFFIYCLRNVDTTTTGCPEGGTIMRSDVNPDDAPIDFTKNTVLGLDNPLIFLGLTDTWNGIQLYVEILDQEQNGTKLIDVIRWNITQPVGVPSGVINLTGLYEIVTMEVNITVLCVPGFTGMMCEENIDDCVGISCSGNGHCVDGVNSFTCNCTSGFTGALCNEIDECVNITFTGSPQYSIAVKIDNYTNPTQATPVKLCTGSSCIMLNETKCCDGFHPGTFQCERCDSFFTYCLRNVDTTTTGCPEGGTIMRSDVNLNDAPIDFSQNTLLGLDNPLIFQGLTYICNGVQLYVEIRDQDQNGNELIDVIRWNIVQHVGVPSGVINLTGLYKIVMMEVNITVLCAPGFTGIICEENIDDCAGVSCSGNGQCLDGANSFTCNCTAGFTGALCNETDECVNMTCSGRGQCIDGDNSFICNCTAGFTGVLCNETDECVNVTCSGRGRCVDGVASYVCDCNAGYTGMMCETDINYCAEVSCSGNGKCVDDDNSFTCNCTSGFTGALCNETDECVNVTCSGRGQCVDGVDSYLCNCDVGFTGMMCEDDIDDCDDGSCSAHGQCVDGVNSFTCNCTTGFTGALCNETDECVNVTCSGRGQCVDGDNSFTCNCTSGFTGALCNETDECVNVTCSGRGQCVDRVASYVCHCDAGYTGGNCEINIDDCLSNPCGTGGQCVDGVASYTCYCDAGYTGEDCEININDCLTNPCGTGGQCVDGVASYTCYCDAGYTGEDCEININDCLTNPCGEGGQCVDGVNSFICTCNPGFTGELCQITIDDCVEVNCSGNDTGPIVGGVVGAIILILILVVVVVVVVVVVLIMRSRITLGKNNQLKGQLSHGHPGGLLGDNPIYELDERIVSTTPQNPSANVQDSDQSSRSESPPDRVFLSPIYCEVEFAHLDVDPVNDEVKTGLGSTLHYNPNYVNVTVDSMLSVAKGTTTEIEYSRAYENVDIGDTTD